MAEYFEIKAKAKVNLFLHINQKIENNYHELESLVYFPDIYDVLRLAKNDTEKEVRLHIVGKFADRLNEEGSESNLIVKAYRLLQKTYPDKVTSGVDIELEKNLPVASGIGGGSSDAAAALKMLNGMFGIGIKFDELKQLGLQLGADVPVCLNGRTTFMKGIGEQVQTLHDFPALHILLVNPLKPVSTAEIFGMGFEKYSKKFVELPEFATTDFLISFLETSTKNDLEKNAVTLLPEIRNIIDSIESQAGCRLSRMSGSGATCFGIFEDEPSLKNALLSLQAKYPDYWIA